MDQILNVKKNNITKVLEESIAGYVYNLGMAKTLLNMLCHPEARKQKINAFNSINLKIFVWSAEFTQTKQATRS